MQKWRVVMMEAKAGARIHSMRAALRSARAARCTPVCLQAVCGDEYQKVAFVVYKRA